MGGQNHYQSEGGFSEYLYHQVGESFEMNGLKCKFVEKINTENSHSGLPTYSNTSDVYFKLSDETGLPEQARFYVGRKVCFDMDWGHEHSNKENGTITEVFPKGVVHVQEFTQNSKGQFRRSNTARYMSNEEIAKFGDILRKIYPNIKFRK